MMKYRDIIFVIGSLQLGTILADQLRIDQTPNFERVDFPTADNSTCVLWQECNGREGFFGRSMKTTTCRTDGGAPQAGDVINPIIRYYDPVPIYKDPQWLQLKKNCPHLDFS